MKWSVNQVNKIQKYSQIDVKFAAKSDENSQNGVKGEGGGSL